ncbi:uncharacterized protein LOC135392354 [Ornithodoros turicata]|uniref:uncharacterized protein LOC135392354 n=1 Tax=Ornithodoros turicata TaxID=34597 RepID=UPI003138C215
MNYNVAPGAGQPSAAPATSSAIAPHPEGSTAASTPSTVQHLAVRLPSFWPENPQVWFLQVECQFALAGITNQTTKYRHVVSVLPQDVAAQLVDLLATPPTQNPYDTLRTATLDRTTASERQRLQQLLTTEGLGDRRPSQLLRHIAVAPWRQGSFFHPSLLKELFLQRLPANVQMILATATSLPLPDFAAHADKIMEVSSPHIAAIPAAVGVQPAHTHSVPVPSGGDSLAHLREDFNRLSAMVVFALQQPRARSRRRTSRRFRSPSNRPTAHPPSHARDGSPAPGLCRYHRRFGAEARHCILPCTWEGNSSGGR